MGGTHRVYIQPILREAEIGLIGNRQGDQRGFEKDSLLVRRVADRLSSSGFRVEVCPGPAAAQVFLVIDHPEARGAELAERARAALEQAD